MVMNEDVLNAVGRLGHAIKELTDIQALPTKIGAKVQWKHNGVIWTRINEDGWRSHLTDPRNDFPYESAHIARFEWTLL